MEPKNHADLELLKAKKMATYYKVKDIPGTVTKDVDMSKRIIKSIPNTYLYFDNDSDVLLPGCATKTFQERGPDSVGSVKIKNVRDHVISDRIGKPLLLDEREIDGKKVMYAESRMLTTTSGDDMLIEYQEGVIDQHSIGFRYIDLDMVFEEDKEWSKWIGMILNPEEAEKSGYMFLVKEIEMFEWSPVSFGSNDLTPYLGVKSDNKDGLLLKINNRLDLLEKQLRTGKQSDFAMFDYELETRQLKQIISELFTQGPSIKDTLLEQRRLKEDTQRKGTSLTVCKNCFKQFNYSKEPESGMGYVKCPGCGQFVDQEGNFTVDFDIPKFRKALAETTFINF